MKLIKDVFVYSYKVMTAALVSKIDVKRSVVDLWLRLNQGEMKQRQDICKVKRK
ncbi:hypothetical protein PAEPH01_1294 [Pancytospora epiphaga]|nr:hypothetical protein PAEPH01_1294 [Pancytospora epiphaga]